MIHTNKKNHPTGFKSPSKVTLIRSKSTDHLPSAHKSVSRKIPPQKTTLNDASVTKVTNLSKTKSTKSLKTKPKSLVKTSQAKSSKKLKPKTKKNNQSQTKTVKKGKKLTTKKDPQIQSFSSSQQSFHPQPLQYFFYHNTYIPIQNSAQRRFVFRIKEVDQRVESRTADSFFNRKNVQSIGFQVEEEEKVEEEKVEGIKVELKENGVGTEKVGIVECGTSMTPRVGEVGVVQTEVVRFAEDTAKCFTTTLNDLQFLFLPQQSNFKSFTRAQRLHYKQLFQSIALKIWSQGQPLQQLTPQRIQVLLYQRQCIQMGMLQYFPQQGFPTHIFAVMSYLTNLFAYVQMNQRMETLERLHGIYGFGYQERLGRVVRGVSTRKRCGTIMSEEMFMSLEGELFKQHTFPSELVEQAVHIHNRAIFDCANQQLEKFKPFYYSRGQPFPWSVNVGMTFFSIDEETLPLLFKQIKEKVLMKFGALCGLLVEYDEFKELPGKEKHAVHIKKLEQHEGKVINEQIAQEKYQPEIEQAEALLRVDLAKWLTNTLIDELCMDMTRLAGRHYQ